MIGPIYTHYHNHSDSLLSFFHTILIGYLHMIDTRDRSLAVKKDITVTVRLKFHIIFISSTT